jgi:hypothetical protein
VATGPFPAAGHRVAAVAIAFALKHIHAVLTEAFGFDCCPDTSITDAFDMSGDNALDRRRRSSEHPMRVISGVCGTGA